MQASTVCQVQCCTNENQSGSILRAEHTHPVFVTASATNKMWITLLPFFSRMNRVSVTSKVVTPLVVLELMMWLL